MNLVTIRSVDGLALHYLTDLSQPMHAANFPNLWVDTAPNPLEWRHSNFETDADDKKIAEAWWDGDYDPSKWGSSPEEVIVKVARKGKWIWTKELKAHVDRKGANGKFGRRANDAQSPARSSGAPVVTVRKA